MTVELKEIRSVLLGRTTLTEDGRITPVQKGEFHISAGVGDGAGAVRILGIAHRSCCFETKLKRESVNEKAKVCMKEIGRSVLLHQQPETAACLIRYVLTRPAVLTFRYIDDVPTLTAWAGRGIAGWLSLRRAIGAFERSLPEEITRSDREPPALPECVKDEKKKKRRRETTTRPEQQPEEHEAETETGEDQG